MSHPVNDEILEILLLYEEVMFWKTGRMRVENIRKISFL